MKKFVFILLMIYMSITMVYAEDYITEDSDFTYDEAINNIQEVMKSYYLRGPNIQYNYARANYGTINPEDATKDDTKHFVCASYTYSTYVEAFGVDGKSHDFPRYNYDLTDAAREYYEAGQNLDGTFLRYYATKNNATEYIYGGNNLVTNFANNVEPGDLFTYTGHAMIAYKVVERTTTNGTNYKDVLMLNSGTGGHKIRSRDSGNSTSDLYYSFFPSTHGNNNILDIPEEGTIKYFWLSEEKHLVNVSDEEDPTKRILKCSQEECTVIRAFTKVGTNGVKFNYPMLKSSYNRSKLRTKYPGIYIEKTIDKIDNNNVYLRDELLYTIKITNKSNIDMSNTNYPPFAIIEVLDKSLVKYVTSSSGTYDENTGKLTFIINSNLAVDNTITLTYKVKVNDNISNVGKTIVATGGLYRLSDNNIDTYTYIPTGKVENKIIAPTVIEPEDKGFDNCYNLTIDSGKTGLELIDKIYECYYGNNKPLDFTNFDITNLIWKESEPLTTKSQGNVVKINSNLDQTYTKFKDAILNNYYGGMARIGEVDENDKYYYILPHWNSSDTRNKYINSKHFENGDVLIYQIDYTDSKTDTYNDSSVISSFPKYRHTAESGVYAYIYINGAFIGLNGTGNGKRNKFTYDYYCTADHNNNPNPICDDTCLESNDIASCTSNTDTSSELKLLTAHLYSNITSITGSNLLSRRKEALKEANYQTLYDKDYYVILRPSKLVPDNIVISFNDNYTVNSDKEILKISLSDKNSGLTYATLLEEVNTNGSVTIKDHDDYQVIFSNESIKTGYTFLDSFSRKVSYPYKEINYKIVVMGDVLGEGLISKNGIKNTIKHIIDGNMITEEINLMAADMDNNNQIRINDITKMLKEYNAK